MITSAEAFASCRARGRSEAVCNEIVSSQMVDGVYCDGTIVINENGKRCVPTELSERVRAARAADPLPVEVVPADQDVRWLVGGAAALVVTVCFLLVTRKT